MEVFTVPIEGKYLLYRPLRRLAFVGNGAMADLTMEIVRSGDGRGAAEERHRRVCEADLYKLRALRALGRDDEANDLARTLREWAEERQQTRPEDGLALLLAVWVSPLELPLVMLSRSPQPELAPLFLFPQRQPFLPGLLSLNV